MAHSLPATWIGQHEKMAWRNTPPVTIQVPTPSLSAQVSLQDFVAQSVISCASESATVNPGPALQLSHRTFLARSSSEVNSLASDLQLVQMLRKRAWGWAGFDPNACYAECPPSRKPGHDTLEQGQKRKRAALPRASHLRNPESYAPEQLMPLSFRFAQSDSIKEAYFLKEDRADINLLVQPVLVQSRSGISTTTIEVSNCTPEEPQPSHQRKRTTYLTIDVYSRRMVHFSRATKRDGNDTKEDSGSKFDAGQPFASLSHTQTLTVRSDTSLADLTNMLRCGQDSIPASSANAQGTASPTGRGSHFYDRARSSPKIVVVEGQWFSSPHGGLCPSDFEATLQQILPDFSAERWGGDPQKITFETLSSIRVGSLNWYLHQGHCEHLFTVRSIRLHHPYVDSTSAKLHLERTTTSGTVDAVVTYLSSRAIARAIVAMSRSAATKDVSSSLKCAICATRPAAVFVVGGSQFRGFYKNSNAVIAETLHATNDEVRLDGLVEHSTPVCKACITVMGAHDGGDVDEPTSTVYLTGGPNCTVVPILE